MRLRTGGRDRSSENAARAREAVLTALQLAPNLPEAHLALARIHLSVSYDLDAAQRAADEADRLRPNDAEVPALRVTLALARGVLGDELSQLITRAVERDPQNADRLYLLGQTLSSLGRYADAEELYDRSRAISPIDSQVRRLAQNRLAWTGDTARAHALFESVQSDIPVFQLDSARFRAIHGDVAGALALLEKVIADATGQSALSAQGRGSAAYLAARLERSRDNRTRAEELLALAQAAVQEAARELPKDYFLASLRANIHAARGEQTAARAALADAERWVHETRNAATIASSRLLKAEALAWLGETDAAIAELRALHERGRAFGYRLRLELEWEPLRRDPQFQQLMKEAEARADAEPRPKR